MRRFLTLAPSSLQSAEARLFLKMVAPDDDFSNNRQSDIDNALKADPNFVPALMAQAALLSKPGESEKAMAIYKTVLQRFPDFAPAQKHLAFLYQQTAEKRDEAYDLALKARETMPEDFELAQMLAKLSYERNNFAYVVHLLQQSAARRPLDAEHLYYLGMAHLKEKNASEARLALDQALAAGLHDPLASDARRTIDSLSNAN